MKSEENSLQVIHQCLSGANCDKCLYTPYFFYFLFFLAFKLGIQGLPGLPEIRMLDRVNLWQVSRSVLKVIRD